MTDPKTSQNDAPTDVNPPVEDVETAAAAMLDDAVRRINEMSQAMTTLRVTWASAITALAPLKVLLKTADESMQSARTVAGAAIKELSALAAAVDALADAMGAPEDDAAGQLPPKDVDHAA